MTGDTLLAGYQESDGKIFVYGEVGFSTIYGTEITPTSSPATLVTLNSLQKGELLGLKSFSPTIQSLFPHRLLMASGNVGNFTVMYRDPTVLETRTGVTLKSYSQGIWLEIYYKTKLPQGIYRYVFDLYFTTSTNFKLYLSGECGQSGFKATTYHEHWSGNAKGTETQTNASGGFLLSMFGTHVHIQGEFRYFGDHLVNYGKAYGINQSGAYNEFIIQKLIKNSDQAVLLGNYMKWNIKNVNVAAVTLDSKSYFYIEKVQNV